jgi:hypothetical protein
MSVTRLIVALLLVAGVAGCSEVPGLKPSKPELRPEVFEPVYRVAAELRAAQEVGMNRGRFGELLEKLATEVSLTKDKAESDRERQVAQGYSDVLQIYKDAAAVWDVKIRIPELKQHAHEWYESHGQVTGDVKEIARVGNFEVAVADQIPLNHYPEGSTGIDGVAARYHLPVTDSNGWKTIPGDSVERIWSQARTKTEQVARMQKG